MTPANLDGRLWNLLPPLFLEKALKKTGLKDDQRAGLAVRETLRFLYLAIQCDRDLFFTGDLSVDSVWHFLITETRFYSGFCEQIRPGAYLHHSGIPYTDYCDGKTPRSLLEEHGSWLASYVRNFGAIEETALEFIPLARELMRRFEVDLPGLNRIAEQLIQTTERTETGFSLEGFLEVTGESSGELDRDGGKLFASLRTLLRSLFRSEQGLPSNGELIRIYTESTALGFTLWQHLAAVERLEGCENWRNKNPDVFEKIRSGERGVGLATTHLAREGGSPLRGERVTGGWKLNGGIPWCSGESFFDDVILGFDSGEDFVFAIVPMPGFRNPAPEWKIVRRELPVLNASNTISAEIADFFVPESAVIQQYPKRQKTAGKATSYRLPEIGMAVGALREARARIRDNAKSIEIGRAADVLQRRIDSLMAVIRDESIPLADSHQIEKSRLIHDCTRLMMLTAGGTAFESDSPVSRRWMESMIPDIVIQAPSVLKGKISDLCG